MTGIELDIRNSSQRQSQGAVLDLAQYALEELRRDGEMVLYRGRHRAPSEAILRAILLLAPVSEHPSPASLARLEHEYSLRAELEATHVVRPLALTQADGRTMLMLEDPGGMPLDRLLRGSMEIAQFLRLGVGITAALGRVHNRELVHKDIKPANILVNDATGQVWLMGFGIASRQPRERQSPEPPELIAGTLPYMAPEQTGRMNRSIDSRSDLYALGVTLYEMLTASLPFTASDLMEWVHCHIARRPVPPAERLKDVPRSISAIVMKLLAKTAEERYQTAAGVESDLRRCLADWERHRRIDDFPLGEHDTPDRLLIPERLYGREREIETLLAAFDRVVKRGTPELVLVSGYSGVGKSSVVNELHKVLVAPRGLFASGKFDQYKRDIPYSTLAQAFQSLIRHLLAKSDAELAPWREALREALGPNGQLMVDLVPELKLIIGDQPPVTDLPSKDAQWRFQLVVRRLIGVFARHAHPLVLFLDDLQWLDAATLDLLEHLLTGPDVRHVLLIGAYRDNEVTGLHPLTRTLDAIRQAGGLVQEISLAPLARDDVGQLVADTLRCEPARAAPLAQLLHEKTAGNPFFLMQFLHALAEEGLLAFEHDQARWSWDLGRIHAKGYTENVVGLMVGKLHRLPAETRTAMQQLACLGNVADITILSVVLATSQEQVHADLWEAVRLELVQRLAGSYKFVHDRVQEAAYSLIPEESRAEAHLRIGRLLAAHTPPEKREEAIFEIVNQLNRAVALITSAEERQQLAELNLVAGKRAKASTAYASALRHLTAGAALLPEDSWERQHELIFTIELQRAECEFLFGELAAADRRLAALSVRASNTVERAAVACLRVDLYTTVGAGDRAVAVGLDYLRHLGIDWSPHPTEEAVRREYERIRCKLDGRTIEELIELPLMSDQASLATLDVLTKLFPPALFTDANLLSLAICRAVNLSLECGNSDGSCTPYVMFGMVAGTRFGDYQAGFRFGRLGCELVEKRGLKRFQARTYLYFGTHVVPWTRHIRASRDLLRRAFEAANKSVDVTFAAYSCASLNVNLLAAGDPLVEVQREAENGLRFAQKARFGLVVDIIAPQLALIRTLRGLTSNFGGFDDGQFDELEFERHLSSNPDTALPECWYWIRKLQARFFAADYEAAVAASSRAQQIRSAPPSLFEAAEHQFYGALSRAASCDCATAALRQQHFEALAAHRKQLEVWAQNCPDNFENRAALVGGEIARIEGRDVDAMRLYEQAIRSARDNGFVHNEALANELAARFYAARGFEQIAQLYLRNARHCYLSWGADGKVRQLDELYPHLKEEERLPGPASTVGTPVQHLDLATVLKVSQAVSGEIVLEQLIDTLMRAALEHAGAERGLLIVPGAGELKVEAEATTSGEKLMVHREQDPIAAAALPQSIVNYVVRTREAVILDDASGANPFSDDEYIRRTRARSVLCLPLMKQNRVIALLYLENNLAARVFTPARIAVLKLLASEAATSLENSRLYRELQEREAKLRPLMDSNIIGVVISDFEGPIIEANDAFLSMVGYRQDDVAAGRLSWKELTPVEWLPANERAMDQVRAGGSCEVFEKEYFRKDGSRVPALVVGAAFEDTRTKGISFVLDLSGRKRAEDSLQKAQAQLVHLSRVMAMGELASSIAHEVNQPIAAIVTSAASCLRWLSAQPPDLDKARRSVQRIAQDGQRAGEIVHRIRALVQRQPQRKEPVDLNQAVVEVLALARDQVRSHAISLHTELAPDLQRVHGDRVQLQQVMLNLIANAVEAMSAIADRPRELIIVSLNDGPRGVRVEVRDTGPGLDRDHAEELFEAFYTTKAEGLGIGLSISRSIIEAHGGRLWATANEPHGAVFQFSLPIEEPTSYPGSAEGS